MTQGWPWFWPLPGGSPTVNLPSGDVSQWFRLFSPTIEVNGKGDADLEAKITRDIATYGAQIGQLNDIVLALAAGQKPPADAVEKLSRISEEIAAAKAKHRENALGRAREALDDLRESDPKGYELLLATLSAREKG